MFRVLEGEVLNLVSLLNLFETLYSRLQTYQDQMHQHQMHQQQIQQNQINLSTTKGIPGK